MRPFQVGISAAALTVGLAVALAPAALAFHNDGVARCEDCHTMHRSEDGAPAATDPSDWLLKWPTSTEVCLQCHGSESPGYGVLSSDPLSPDKQGKGAGGGDFVFLTEDNLNDGAGGAVNPILGERAGHNVAGAGLPQETTHTTSPGGSYPSNKLTCTSCHDPHGGVRYRFLYGSQGGRNAKSRSMGYTFTFTAPSPVADEMSVFATESDSNHNAYKSGMTNWCRACHKVVHKGRSGFVHPRDRKLGGNVGSNYNRYNGTLDPENPSLANPYLALVPVEWNSASNTTTFSGQISEDARVMCLSCHRAHASSGPHSGRWDFNIATWADEGSSGSYPIENPYASSSGNDQRRLCEKCHGLDVPND